MKHQSKNTSWQRCEASDRKCAALEEITASHNAPHIWGSDERYAAVKLRQAVFENAELWWDPLGFQLSSSKLMCVSPSDHTLASYFSHLLLLSEEYCFYLYEKHIYSVFNLLLNCSTTVCVQIPNFLLSVFQLNWAIPSYLTTFVLLSDPLSQLHCLSVLFVILCLSGKIESHLHCSS